MANPWGKFFWNDWENDPELKLCSLAAQGLWMRCLCIAAKADPIGYVIVRGRPLDADSLARLTGAEKSYVETLLSELDQNGVFSRDRKGRIYSRRMVRDYKKMQIARRNGAKGGNPRLCSERENSPPDKGDDKAKDKPHKPEAIYQSKLAISDSQGKRGAEILSVRDALPPGHGFDDETISDAIDRWLKNGHEFKDVTAGIRTAVARRTFKRADTIGYFDGAIQDAAKDRKRKAPIDPSKVTFDQWRTSMRFYRKTNEWKGMGAAPGEPGCMVPPEIIAEFEQQDTTTH